MLEGPAITTQPNFQAMVGDQFGSHVLAASQGYREEQSLHDLSGYGVDDCRPSDDVGLGDIGWLKI